MEFPTGSRRTDKHDEVGRRCASRSAFGGGFAVHVEVKGGGAIPREVARALGAEIFIGARVLHPILYAAGVSWLRTGVWFVGVVGMGIVAYALI